MNQGFIKLHRNVLEDPVIMKDADYFAIWCYLLLHATHAEREVDFNGRITTLHPGELITGRKKIENDLKINEHKVDRVLNKFKSEQRIEQRTSQKGRLIKVLSWNETQKIEQQIEQQLSNKRATSEQQVSTNKNERMKECKNERNIDSGAKPQRSHFVKPTIEEIQNYCIERNNSVNPQRFYDYYEARGWCLSKGQKVKDWKACIRTWENSGYNNKPQEEPTQNTSIVDEQEWIKNYEAMRQAEEKAREKALAEKLGIKL